MKKIGLVLPTILFVLLISTSLVSVGFSSVIWSQRYDRAGEQGVSSMVQTSNGGFALVGSIDSLNPHMDVYPPDSSDIWFVKTDANGNIEWNKTYSGEEADIVKSIIETSDNGYALVGQADSLNTRGYDFWLVKTDANGNEEWNKTYGLIYNDFAQSLIETDDGGFAIAGYGLTDNLEDFLLVKTDSYGNMMWNKTYGGEDRDYAYSVVETSDGGFALAGYSSHSNSVFWLVKTDELGNMEWNQTYGDEVLNRAYFVVETSDGGYILAGKKSSNAAVSIDFCLVKTDANGNMMWSQTYGKSVLGWGGYPLIVTSDGGYAFASSLYNETTGMDCWFVKTDVNGNVEWNQTDTLAGDQSVSSLVETSDGGYALAGSTGSFEIDDDFWLVRTDIYGIPEFPSWIILPLFVLVTLIMIIVRNKIQKGLARAK